VRRADGGWVLNGAKRYITNAPVADLFMVFARHGEPGQAPGDISVFLVPRDVPGLSVGPRDQKMGQHGALTAEVFLDGVRCRTRPWSAARPGTGTDTAPRCGAWRTACCTSPRSARG
jgi:acyl-CoA dehydrogenase